MAAGKGLSEPSLSTWAGRTLCTTHPVWSGAPLRLAGGPCPHATWEWPEQPFPSINFRGKSSQECFPLNCKSHALVNKSLHQHQDPCPGGSKRRPLQWPEREPHWREIAKGPHCVPAEEMRKNLEEMSALRYRTSEAEAAKKCMDFFRRGRVFPSGFQGDTPSVSNLPQSRKPS